MGYYKPAAIQCVFAEKLLADYANEEGKAFKGFDDDVRGVFTAYPWPGNVRQLQNVVRNIVVLNDGEWVSAEMLPAPLDVLVGAVAPLPSTGDETHPPKSGGSNLMQQRPEDLRPLEDMERDIIEHAIRLCDDNVPKAAAHLGISASTIYRKRQSWEE